MPTKKKPEEIQLELGFEERADHVSEDVLVNDTVISDFYDRIHKSLIEKGLALISGPRGCGKTHMMRYTALTCKNDKKFPLAIYVNFNRYLRLEPLLITRPDALMMFQAWVLARIILAVQDLATPSDLADGFDYAQLVCLDTPSLEKLIDRLERGISSPEDQLSIEQLSIEGTIKIIEAAVIRHGRTRAVVLLDDAALALTPDYLVEFFDIVRVLKRSNISPKASVYPGTTEYGPRFHAMHEGKQVEAWLPIDDPDYAEIMGRIALKRYPDSAHLQEDVNNLLKYASFGVPRAYLTMVREICESQKSDQATINNIVRTFRDDKLEEFRSLALKMPKLATLVKSGEAVFKRIITAVREQNNELLGQGEKQLRLGIDTSDFSPLTSRMFNLLVEAGLLRELTDVSHGQDRTYRRFTPHLGALIADRGLSGAHRGFSAKAVLASIALPHTKHPVRRSIATLLPGTELSHLSLDEPPCQKCQTARLNDSQKFCHHCGAKLVDTSTYSHCLGLSVQAVPYLTTWQKTKLAEHNYEKIKDILSLQDPGTALREIWGVGTVRSGRMVGAVQTYVDEFLS